MEEKWWEQFSIFGISGYVLFIISEIFSLTKMKSNGVVEFVSRRLGILGGRRIRIEVGINALSNSSGGSSVQEEEEEEEEPLLNK